ncbi:helix-turn-helix transcriptional regulator, partial [Klebsiella pneumoniae]|uniref:helix-turn-helix transcriptional regulator n=1 Tax=Klebsiella pneumoniae TaxID=573 RepID=UPI0025A1966B
YENGGYSACAMLAEMMANPRAKPHQLSYGVECVTKRASSCACEDKRVLRAVEFIRRHACERINLDDVANEMGCSRRLATRVFRQSH